MADSDFVVCAMPGEPDYLEPVLTDCCGAYWPGNGRYRCTLPGDHEGDHAAHNNSKWQMARWSQ